MHPDRVEPNDLLAPVPSDDDLDALIVRLESLHRSASWDFVLAVGRLVLDTLYEGSWDAWRHRGDRDSAFRALVRRLDGRASGLTGLVVYRAVATLDLEERFHLAEHAGLSLSHVRAVLGLPADVAIRLLQSAESSGWSTRALEAEASRARRREGETRGRPRLPGFIKALNAAERTFASSFALTDLDAAERLSAGERDRVTAQLRALRTHVDRLEAALAIGGAAAAETPISVPGAAAAAAVG